VAGLEKVVHVPKKTTGFDIMRGEFEFRNHSEIRETCGYQRDASIISGTRPGTVRYGSENLNTGRSNACLLCWTVPGKPGTVNCTLYPVLLVVPVPGSDWNAVPKKK